MGLLDVFPKDSIIGRIISHRHLYIFGICLVLCGLSWSNVVISIGQFVLIGNWLMEANFKEKFKRLWANKAACLVIAFFILHVIGLSWSSDFDYGVKDIRIKMVLLVIPFVLASSRPLTVEQFKFLLHFFVVSVFVVSLFSYAKYFGIYGPAISDKRELTIRISHIRYGLIIAFSFFCCVYYGMKIKKYKWLYFLAALYFLISLVTFQLYSGLIILFIISCFLLLKSLFDVELSIFSKLFAAISLLLLILVPGIAFFQVYKDFNRPPQHYKYDQENLEVKTEAGNSYRHYLELEYTENGYYVWRFINENELRQEWNKKSALDYDERDKKGQVLRSTLIRYLTSMALFKDSAGVSKLSERDIKAIENGTANYYLTYHNKIQGRIHSTLYEIRNYHKFHIAEGFSIAMRFEYWKVATNIIEDHLPFGVGTGDIQQEFNKKYRSGESVLKNEDYWRRSHNQFLSTWVQLGVLGFLLLLMILFYPIFHSGNNKSFLFMVFIALIFLSMLTEDTLETQVGATLYAIFFSLFLVNPKP